MSYEMKSIADQIDCLARLTCAPEAFVTQVRDLFGRKGISLAEDVAPYLAALEEAFRREESIRFNTSRARQQLSALQQHFHRLGRSYVEQLSQPKKAKSVTEGSVRAARDRSSATHVTIRGDHRTLVTRTEREELPLVPGPEEVQ